MENSKEIAENLDLLFIRQELKELRDSEAKLKLELEESNRQLQESSRISRERADRIRQLEGELLRFVEDFLSTEPNKLQQKEQTAHNEPHKPNQEAKQSCRRSNKKANFNNFENYSLVLYFIYCEPANAVKIGYTSNIRARLSGIQVGNPYKLSLVTCFPIPDKSWETWMHDIFKDFWINGEWFSVNKNILHEIKCLPTFKVYDSSSWAELHDYLSLLEDVMKNAYQCYEKFVKSNRKNNTTLKTIGSADTYLLSLNESTHKKQKSLTSEGTLAIQ